MFQEKGGGGVEATENGKLVEKPEENEVGEGTTNIKLYIQTWGKDSQNISNFLHFISKYFVSIREGWQSSWYNCLTFVRLKNLQEEFPCNAKIKSKLATTNDLYPDCS